MLSSDPFGFASRVTSPSGGRIAKDHAVLTLQRLQRGRIAEVVALHVPDGNLHHLALRSSVCVKGGSTVSVRRCTCLQMYFSPALRISAPGSSPASHRI